MKSNIIFGVHPVLEALHAKHELDRIFIQKGPVHGKLKEIQDECFSLGIPIQKVPVEKLNRITGKNHQGVIAYQSIVSYASLENIIDRSFQGGSDPLLLILDRITDVRNFGAIARTAEGFGFNGIIIPEYGSAQINEDAMKTSAGALNNVPICRTDDLIGAINYLKSSGLVIVGATEKTDKFYYDLDFKIPMALVMGSEESGISSQVLSLLDAKAKIPLKGSIASLNVSVAAGVLLYEVVRQRLDS